MRSELRALWCGSIKDQSSALSNIFDGYVPKEPDIGFGLPKAPGLIKADNQGTIALTKDPHFHSRTKHIDIQWPLVRGKVDSGVLTSEWVATNNMAADGLINALTNERFASFVRQIGLH